MDNNKKYEELLESKLVRMETLENKCNIEIRNVSIVLFGDHGIDVNFEVHAYKPIEETIYIYFVVYDLQNKIREKDYVSVRSFTFGNFEIVSKYVDLQTTANQVSKILMYPSFD